MTPRNYLDISLVGGMTVALGLTGCGGSTTPADGSVAGDGSTTGPATAAVLAQYATIVSAEYDDSVATAQTLSDDIDALLATPNATTLAAARASWAAARIPYMQSEAFRFYGGPIDDPETGPEGRINSWPMDEAFVDYVVDAMGMPVYGGLVNTPTQFPDITAESIAEVNQTGGSTDDESEANVGAGYHAVEFLLWGQDLSTTGAGDRPAADFDTSASGTMNAERRRTYLRAVTDLLVDDLTSLSTAWSATQAGNYRSTFVNDESRGVALILTGIYMLSVGELPNERIRNAYTLREQEEEHSCFSDTTLADHYNDELGIENVYLGRYTRTDGTMLTGPSVSDLVRARDAALDTRVRAAITAAHTAVEGLASHGMPFDQMILQPDGSAPRMALLTAITALGDQARAIRDAATALGVDLETEE